ncbi:MAG: type II toxin-antitoxin system HipA family toxin [Clostridia bacterium]|nr:type II toxin-antitoxin system HipA family toxin [Clostridia bacterium]
MKEHKVEVWFADRFVGTLAETADRRVAFAYSDEWLETGFAISPFSLPVEQKVFVPTSPHFQGMWGVFADSLPDAWGRLLVNRMLQTKGLNPDDVTPLERLAIVGDSGMGALTYRPAWDVHQASAPFDLDELSDTCRAILNREEVRDLDAVFQMGGSSGGARPKVMTEEWVIKFPASGDTKDTGVMEKAYMDCAADCGIIVPESRLMPSKQCSGYFAVRRFDREQQGDGIIRRHMLTAAAILEADWRSPSLDYNTLMKLTSILSRGNQQDLLQMFRRMCFNVFAHNRDDHAKNFSWLYDAKNDCWHPSPAYDLTWSTTYYGEHTTTVNGNGRNPGMQELLAVGKAAGLQQKVCKQIAEEIREKTVELEQMYRDVLS